MSTKQLNYDTRVFQLFRNKRYTGHRVGLELEYENVNLHKISMADYPLWNADIDHSLRASGIEFISKPLNPNNVTSQLERIDDALVKTKAQVTKRCGLHVHVNCTDYTLRELWKVITLYALLEPFIFREFAHGREDSHFCVPLWANTSLQTKLYHDAVNLHRGKLLPTSTSRNLPSANTPQFVTTAMLSTGGGTKKRSQYGLELLGNAKYSAMNYTSLIKFGTVEYRQARSTLDVKEIDRWVKFLIALHEHALSYTDADDIVSVFYEEGHAPFCKALGLKQYPDTNPEFIEDAEDAAILCVGHPPTNFKDLKWEIT